MTIAPRTRHRRAQQPVRDRASPARRPNDAGEQADEAVREAPVPAGESPQPLIWSAIMLPTKPVKNPTIGPNAYPKKVTIAKAGRTETFAVPGMRMLKRREHAVERGADGGVDDHPSGDLPHRRAAVFLHDGAGHGLLRAASIEVSGWCDSAHPSTDDPPPPPLILSLAGHHGAASVDASRNGARATPGHASSPHQRGPLQLLAIQASTSSTTVAGGPSATIRPSRSTGYGRRA